MTEKTVRQISAADIFMAESTTTEDVIIAERMMSKRIMDATACQHTKAEITRVLGDGDDAQEA